MTGNFIALLAVCAFYAYCVGLAIAWLYRKNKREGGLVRALGWGALSGFSWRRAFISRIVRSLFARNFWRRAPRSAFGAGRL